MTERPALPEGFPAAAGTPATGTTEAGARVGETLADGTVRVVTPPVVYLPCALDEHGELAEIRMVRLRDGRVALMAYSALDRLARACGDRHPWVVFDTALLDELRTVKPYDAAYLDVPLPVELRQGGPT